MIPSSLLEDASYKSGRSYDIYKGGRHDGRSQLTGSLDLVAQ